MKNITITFILFVITNLFVPIVIASAMDENEVPLVEVEPTFILPSDLASSHVLVPYQARRPKWGHYFVLTYSQYHPTNFESDFAGASDFTSEYGTEPMFEISYTHKKNFILGSLGGDIGVGIYNNDGEADSTVGDAAKLSLKIVRLGVKYTMDNLMTEPYIAPYAVGGVYTAIYSEKQGSAAETDGTTGPAAYYGAGLLFQISKIDKTAAIEGYIDSGMENTFLFTEARQYMASNAEDDPDFSTDFDLNFGLVLEF